MQEGPTGSQAARLRFCEEVGVYPAIRIGPRKGRRFRMTLWVPARFHGRRGSSAGQNQTSPSHFTLCEAIITYLHNERLGGHFIYSTVVPINLDKVHEALARQARHNARCQDYAAPPAHSAGNPFSGYEHALAHASTSRSVHSRTFS